MQNNKIYISVTTILLSIISLLLILKKLILAKYAGDLLFILFVVLTTRNLYDYCKGVRKLENDD